MTKIIILVISNKMVFFAALEFGIQGSIFVLKQTYYLGRYLILGRQKTQTEILEEKLEEQMEKEDKLMHFIKEELYELKSHKTDDIDETKKEGKVSKRRMSI